MFAVILYVKQTKYYLFLSGKTSYLQPYIINKPREKANFDFCQAKKSKFENSNDYDLRKF